MDESEVTMFQSLVDLRELIVSDYTGDHAEMKELIDQNIMILLKKQLDESEK